MTKLYTTDDIGSISYGGNEYRVKNGVVDVPSDAVPVLLESYGFSAKRPAKTVSTEGEAIPLIPDAPIPETPVARGTEVAPATPENADSTVGAAADDHQ